MRETLTGRRYVMKAYFWANLNGTIVNTEVRHIQVYRNMRPINLLWKLALDTGVADEVEIDTESRLPAPAWQEITFDAKSIEAKLGNRRHYPQAFLTIIEAVKKSVKYRLKDISFVEVGNTTYASDTEPDKFGCFFTVAFAKSERTQDVQCGK
jgi:hypothetical protein